ncbi:MAG: hypothetical protein AB7Y46_07830 [Armatimonadota bacterium]
MSGGDWGRLTDEDVDRLTVSVLRPAWRARPELRHIRLADEDAVVKDYGRRGNLFKRLLGAFLAQREAAALRRAEGVPNVPRLLASPRPWMIVTEHIEAVPVTSPEAPALGPGFFARLSDLIDQLHARGIAHGDLEKLDNVLVTADGRPALVDFAAAIMAGSNPLAALALPHVQESDRRGISKLKAQQAPELLSDAERCRLEHRSAAERWFRRLRHLVRRPVKALAVTGREAGGL